MSRSQENSTQNSQSRAVANDRSLEQDTVRTGNNFADNREETKKWNKLRSLARPIQAWSTGRTVAQRHLDPAMVKHFLRTEMEDIKNYVPDKAPPEQRILPKAEFQQVMADYQLRVGAAKLEQMAEAQGRPVEEVRATVRAALLEKDPPDAFYNRLNQTLYYLEGVESPKTDIHEATHHFSREDADPILGHALNEVITEMIAQNASEKLGHPPAAPLDWQASVDAAKHLKPAIKDALYQVYFGHADFDTLIERAPEINWREISQNTGGATNYDAIIASLRPGFHE